MPVIVIAKDINTHQGIETTVFLIYPSSQHHEGKYFANLSILLTRNILQRILILVTGFISLSVGQRAKVISRTQRARKGKQIGDEENLGAGIDFSGCMTDPDTGLCCVDKLEQVTTLQN